jgi:hypothetical protein
VLLGSTAFAGMVDPALAGTGALITTVGSGGTSAWAERVGGSLSQATKAIVVRRRARRSTPDP